MAVAAYGIEKKAEQRWDRARRKHDSMSDAEEGETWDEVQWFIHMTCTYHMYMYHTFRTEEVQTLRNSLMTKQHSKGGTTITS